MMDSPVTYPRVLRQVPTHEKLLYSAFLILVGIGYLMSLTLIYETDASLDGKSGLSVEDITDSYYGNRSGTRLEEAIRGAMAPHLANSDERTEIVAWLKSGATEAQYRSTVKPILDRDCIQCHSPSSGMGLVDLSNFAGVSTVAHVDKGASIQSLVKLSHIHLFGICLLLLAVGLIFRRAELPSLFKYTVILTPFAALLVDIASWFITKWDPVYAYTVVISGALLGLGFGIQILVSLYQMWLWRPRLGLSDS